jgi:hypothetical protein
LIPFGVPNPIGDPVMQLFSGSTVIDNNDDWVDASNSSTISSRGTALGAFAPSSILEAILLRSVAAGPYTVQVVDFQGRSGEVVIEAYDAQDTAGRLSNLSTRTQVGGAAGILTAGFVISGSGNMTLLIRGIGPTLAGFGVPNHVGDPRIQVLNSNSFVLASNDDWNSSDAQAKRDAATAVGAFALQENSFDAALLISLPAGSYTAQVIGSGASGDGVVEIYEVP